MPNQAYVGALGSTFSRFFRVPNALKMSLRWFSSWKVSWKLHGGILGGFWEAKMVPKTAQDAAKTLQDGAETVQERQITQKQ